MWIFVNELQPPPPKRKRGTFNGTFPTVLLRASSILEMLFLRMVVMYFIEIDKLRDYQQK